MSAQPPSGGCVLKRVKIGRVCLVIFPAAFGRLCVETADSVFLVPFGRQPPSGGCVLKRIYYDIQAVGISQPPSGGCVLKLDIFCQLAV